VSRRTRSDSGFLLVGVVMFVLALTILGLSLYALSDYESDFQMQSRDANAAFYSAQGGLAMVQAVLAAPGSSLGTADTVVRFDNGITFAIAKQARLNGDSTSTGPINWSTPVRITVTAESNHISRTLEAVYRPTSRENYYKRLFTVSGTSVTQGSWGPTISTGIFVEVDNAPFDAGQPNRRMQTIELGDTCHVWQTSANATWASVTDWASPGPIRVSSVPVPDVQSYYANHPTTGLVPESENESGSIQLKFNRHSPGTIGYYGSPGTTNTNYSYWASANLELQVQGYAVWELPHGLRSENEVTVKSMGAGPAVLVIVGSPFAGRTGSTIDPNTGLWFFGGLTVPISMTNNVTVILVSDGQVNIERSNNPTGMEQLSRLSVYANSLYLMGPRIGSSTTLDHAKAMDLDGGVIDALESAGALPQPAGVAASRFALVRGSWRDLTP
jgi:Tfp pilus assembly protein PilX